MLLHSCIIVRGGGILGSMLIGWVGSSRATGFRGRTGGGGAGLGFLGSACL